MENFGGDENLRNLINELAQGRDAATQLQMILNAPSSYYQETHEFLVQNILSSYDKALSMLNYVGSSKSAPSQPLPVAVGPAFGIESPSSFAGSPPHSEDSDRENDGLRRRNAQRWTQKVRVSPGSSLEGHLDDGYSWRKYGQKDILGARHPRGYYRCTHRHAQGCLATKQVQRSDEDPTIFDITYRGRHTCNQLSAGGNNANPPPPSPPPQIPPQNQEPNLRTAKSQMVSNISHSETLLNFQREPKVETNNFDTTKNQENHQPVTYTYNFPSTSNINMLDNSHFSWSFSPSFGSPVSSASSEVGRVAGGQNVLQTNYAQLITTNNNTSVSGTMGFDSNFTFDSHGFFS